MKSSHRNQFFGAHNDMPGKTKRYSIPVMHAAAAWVSRAIEQEGIIASLP